MKTMLTLTTRTLIATVLVLVGTMLIGGVVFAVFGNPWGEVPEAGEVFLPLAVSSALLSIALLMPVRFSALARWPRVAAVFITCLGVNVLLMQVEAAAFLDMTTMQLAVAVTNATLVAAWLSVVTGVLFGRSEASGTDPVVRSRIAWARIAGCAAAYLLLYLIAGMAIYPMVADYYAAQNFEAGPWIVPLAFIRGGLYVVFSLWLIRSMRCTRGQCALAIAVMFPLLAGVAALVIPSGFMPPGVRFWHAIEVGVSNFVYGLLVGWLFWPGTALEAGDIKKADLAAGSKFPDESSHRGRVTTV